MKKEADGTVQLCNTEPMHSIHSIHSQSSEPPVPADTCFSAARTAPGIFCQAGEPAGCHDSNTVQKNNPPAELPLQPEPPPMEPTPASMRQRATMTCALASFVRLRPAPGARQRPTPPLQPLAEPPVSGAPQRCVHTH